MRLQKWFLFLFAIVTGSFASVAQIHTFKNFSYQEGVNLASVLSVEECENGYLWFGTDGAGLMRYDGKTFDYLEGIQGRNNRHVNDIFFYNNKILFSTKYRGVFLKENNSIEVIQYIKRIGRSLGVYYQDNRFIILQDSGLKIYKDGVLVQEKSIFPLIPNLHYYGNFQLGDELFFFTSDKNFHVKGNTIVEMYEWLGIKESQFNDFVVAYSDNDSLFFLDKYLSNRISVPLSNVKGDKVVKDSIVNPILLPEEEVVKWDKKNNTIAFITNMGRLVVYDISTSRFSLLTNVSSLKIANPTSILIDRNKDIWVTTSASGIYRVSLEPFTKLEENNLFKDPHISFVGKTIDQRLILSIEAKKSYLSESNNRNIFKKSENFFVTSMTQIGDLNLISTRKGVYQIKNGLIELYQPLDFLKDEKVSLILNAFGYLWYSIESKGLFRKDLNSGHVKSYPSAPAYIYNAISSKDSSTLYFGTNFGLMKYERAKDELVSVSRTVNGKVMGSYVGNSIMDSHGTLWFSFDEGLMGITEKQKVVSITEENFLPSLLIFTLNIDRFGHLIVGSNKGITVLNVNKDGEALSSRTYDKENGFYGHETHMRSAYQSLDGSIYLGTLDGLVLVRPEYLENKTRLNKPIIQSFKDKDVENLLDKNGPIVINKEDNHLKIEFKSINTKSNFVSYSYKLEGGDGEFVEWTEWSPKQEAIFNNLGAGAYEFKVKSSIAGENQSEINTLTFVIEIPFYKNKWFIIIVISLAVFINVLVIDRTSSFNRKNIILSRDIVADRSIAKSILMFGAVANTLGHIFAPRIEESLKIHDYSAIAVGLIILTLFFIVTYVDRAIRKAGVYLSIGFLILIAYNLGYTYLSNIHPFYFIATLLTTFVAPYTLRNLRSAVFVSLALGILSVVIMFLVDDAQFNQYLFLMGIALACFLMIYKTYLRNNSLEQLIFTSGVVNKGNALVVAFDKTGKISYASENIEILLGINKSLKGENVLYLNEFQPFYNEMKSFSDSHLIDDFKEGAIFVTPLFTEKDEVVYYQWSCKQFSEELRIILGQDVTEKITLENYYELIVRNADDLIFQTDTMGNFTFVNEKCCEVFARTKEDLLNMSILNVVKDSSQTSVRNFFDKNLRERNRGDYKEVPIITSLEGGKWLGVNLTPMKRPGAENVVTGFLGLARDITSTRKAHAIIKEQNKDITSSINYARRIQFNMLPSSLDFEKSFDEHVIMYRPKDIVSGDFFWLKDLGEKTILVLSDCTGHGVPGSFMTLLGINILNQIILEIKAADPGDILNQLDQHLSDVLPRDGENRIQDGMEAVVCVFDKSSNKVEYALAGGRFLIKDNEKSELKVVKGQIKHIGDIPETEDFAYKTESIDLLDNQMLYLFTDGFPDQFGGEKNKKITIKRFLALIDEISIQSTQEQSAALEKYFNEWIGDFPQTDDITVIGVKGRK